MLDFKTFGQLPTGAALERLKQSPNFDGKIFQNPVHTDMSMPFLEVGKEYIQSKSADRRPPKNIPVQRYMAGDFDSEPSQKLKISWWGHASMMMELAGQRILMDPVLCERASPFSWAGPKRFHSAPIDKDQLPHVDVLLLSHNHYDHMDYESLSQWTQRDIQFVCPLAVGATLAYWGVDKSRITELDWHETFEWKGIRFTATPARHFTARGLTDRFKTFWCSYVIQAGETKVFFGGDSGDHPGFKDIGDQYGPFDLSMVGIGAYNDHWAGVHTNPEEAIHAHLRLRAKRFLPMHWATFDLALHSWSEPIERVVKEAERKQISLLLPRIGEWIEPDNYMVEQYWWR